MKLKYCTLIVSISYLIVLSSCVKEENDLLLDSPNPKKELIIDKDILDGTYAGKISIDRIIWTGATQKPDTSYSYPLNFIIRGNQFSRAECGLYGYIEINKEKGIVEFKNKGANNNNSNFRNWIIDTFYYKIESGSITIFKKDPQPTNQFLGSTYGNGSQFNIISISAVNLLIPK